MMTSRLILLLAYRRKCRKTTQSDMMYIYVRYIYMYGICICRCENEKKKNSRIGFILRKMKLFTVIYFVYAAHCVFCDEIVSLYSLVVQTSSFMNKYYIYK